MSDLPNFSSYGYYLKKELGHNRTGGRVTYLAIDTQTRQPVVIKQFQFAQSDSHWSGYEAYNQEIQVLQGLNHPGIPRYLNAFQTPNGYCMVQEYKKAPSLARRRSFDPDEIKQIAVSALEILVYLQNRIPSVIHRDIKPENILVDDNINVYLVDFGFARIGDGEVAMSSMVKGTLGFMPPEQLFNRQLTEASDLYGLGATLICLLTGTKSTAISNLVDDSYQLNFKHLVPKLSLRWISWLEKMVELRPKDRYPNAAAALEALKPIYIIRLPEVKLSQPNPQLIATKLGEKLTQTITLSNSIPETVLEGSWEVAPHSSDPPHTPAAHTWITFQPAQFEGNQSKCKIIVNTSKLMANKIYEREILLHSNASPETQTFTLKVQTAPVPVKSKRLPYIFLSLLVALAVAATWIETVAWAGTVTQVGAVGVLVAVFVTVFMAVFGAATAVIAGSMGVLASGILSRLGTRLKGVDTTMAVLVAGVVALVVAGFGAGFRSMDATATSLGLVDIVAFMAGFTAESVAASSVKRGFGSSLAAGVSLLATALGISLGFGLQLGFLHGWLISAVLVIGLSLGAILLYPPLHRLRLIANYRKGEQYLIQP